MSELDDLLAVSTALGAEPSEEALTSALVDGVARLVGVDSVTVRLLDASGISLHTQARIGDPFHKNKGFDFVIGEGLVGWVCKHQRPLRVPRAEEDPRFSPRPDQERPIGGFLAVPVMGPTQCLGVIAAASEHDAHFTERHEELLRLVASVFSAHLQLAQLRRAASPDAVTGLSAKAWGAGAADDGAGLVDPLSFVCVAIDDLADHRSRSGVGFVDSARRTVAEALGTHRREGDALAQLTDHRFLLALPRVALPTAVRIAERLRHAVHAELERRRTGAAPVTVSLAVTTRRRDEPRAGTEARLEAALASAQKRGGGVVEIAR